jgi:hypothetical protein
MVYKLIGWMRVFNASNILVVVSSNSKFGVIYG